MTDGPYWEQMRAEFLFLQVRILAFCLAEILKKAQWEM
jgi:hypothetical protein